jgi:hypothetical protein
MSSRRPDPSPAAQRHETMKSGGGRMHPLRPATAEEQAAKQALLRAFFPADVESKSRQVLCQPSKDPKVETHVPAISKNQSGAETLPRQKCGYYPDQFQETTFQPRCGDCSCIPDSAVVMLCCGAVSCLAAVPRQGAPWKSPCCGVHKGAQPCFSTRARVEALQWTCLYCKDARGRGTEALNFHQLGCQSRPPTRKQIMIDRKVNIISLTQTELSRPGPAPELLSAVRNVLASNLAYSDLESDTVRRWMPQANDLLVASRERCAIRRRGGGRHTALDPRGGQEHSLEFQRLWEAERSKKSEPGCGITNTRLWQVLLD